MLVSICLGMNVRHKYTSVTEMWLNILGDKATHPMLGDVQSCILGPTIWFLHPVVPFLFGNKFQTCIHTSTTEKYGLMVKWPYGQMALEVQPILYGCTRGAKLPFYANL